MDVTVYLPTVLAISAIRLVLPRKKLGRLYDLVAIPLGIVNIALGIITYEALKNVGAYSPLVPAVLAIVGLTLTHKLYSFKYAPYMLASIIGLIAVELAYTYFAVTEEVLLIAIFIVVSGVTYSIVTYVFAILDFISRFLNLLPFRLIIALAALGVAIAIATGYPLPARDFSL